MTRAGSSPAETAARIVGKRFRVLAVLARGGGVETLHVHDELTGEEAVLKTIPHARLAPGALQRLERDAHLLGGLSGSGSPPRLELGREDDLHFLVMPFVRGLPLRRRLEAGPLAIREMLEVARCVLRTLVHAHGAGVLHGNLRPENIVVDAAPAARATLIDFGLARIGQLDVSARDLPVDSL